MNTTHAIRPEYCEASPLGCGLFISLFRKACALLLTIDVMGRYAERGVSSWTNVKNNFVLENIWLIKFKNTCIISKIYLHLPQFVIDKFFIMKTRFVFFLSAALLSISSTHAQYVLTREANYPRPGDILIQEEVESQDPGKSGKDVLWNFSRLIPVERKKGIFTKPSGTISPNEDIRQYMQEITTSEVEFSYLADDSGRMVRGLEIGGINSYSAPSDSLSIWNEENSSMRMEFSLPQVLLTYPFAYKNQITNYYSGYGVYYDQMGVKLVGGIDAEADGYGTLVLPGNDTIRNVLRIRIIKTALEEKESSYDKKNGKEWKVKGDSIASLIKLNKKNLPTTETVRWYAEGYRYPLLEMIYSYIDLGGNKKANESRQAFFYDPVQQKVDYMSSDAINRSIGLKQQQPSKKAVESSTSQTAPAIKEISFDYNIYPNPVDKELKIDLHFSGQTSAQFSLYNINSRKVYQSVNEYPAGHSTVKIPVSGLPKGNYFVHIVCGEKTIVEKIIKK